MRLLLIFLFTSCFFLHSPAQQKVVDVGKQDVLVTSNMFYSVAGSPISTTKYIRLISGSPYFKDEWMTGNVELPDGQVYEGIRLKLDLSDNSVVFVGPDSVEMIANAAIKKITLRDNLTGKIYEFVHSAYIQGFGKVETGWYMPMASGRGAALYKRIVKRMNESKPYGSATAEQSISSITQYFLASNLAFNQVKKFKDLPGLLPDKKDDLSKYLASLKLTGKSDGDYIELVNYYNDITAK